MSETYSKSSTISKIMKHIENASIVRTVYSSIFNDIWGYSGQLMRSQPH